MRSVYLVDMWYGSFSKWPLDRQHRTMLPESVRSSSVLQNNNIVWNVIYITKLWRWDIRQLFQTLNCWHPSLETHGFRVNYSQLVTRSYNVLLVLDLLTYRKSPSIPLHIFYIKIMSNREQIARNMDSTKDWQVDESK